MAEPREETPSLEGRSPKLSTSGEESVRLSALFAFGVQLTTAAFTAVLTLYLVRALGPNDYGAFSLALATVALFAVPADLGISPSTSRFAAEARGDSSAVADAIAAGFKPKLISAALVSAVLFVASGPIASAYNNQNLLWPLRVSALAFFGQTFFLFFQRTFIAQGRLRPNLRIQLVESSIETGASIGLVVLGAGATGAMFGRAAGYLAGAAFAVLITIRLLGPSAVRLGRGLSRLSRRIIRYAGPLTVVDSVYTAYSQIDVVLIGLILDVTAVGRFQAPVRLLTLLGYPGASVAQALSPRYAWRGQGVPSPKRFEAALRYLCILQGVLVAPLVVWARPIVHVLLGSAYTESALVLAALTPYMFLSGISPLTSVTPNYLGVAKQRIPIVITTIAMNIVIDLILIPRIGIVGGAIGTDVAYTFYVLAHLKICRKLLGISLRPLANVLARTGLASLAMGAVLFAVGTSSLSLADWFVGSVGGLVAFLFVLVATREVSVDELRALARWVRRKRP